VDSWQDVALYLSPSITRKCWTLQGLTEFLTYIFHQQHCLCFHVKGFLQALLSLISGNYDTFKKKKYRIL